VFPEMCPLRFVILFFSLLVALIVITQVLVSGDDAEEVFFAEESRDEEDEGTTKKAPHVVVQASGRRYTTWWQFIVSMFTGRFLYRHYKYVGVPMLFLLLACCTRNLLSDVTALVSLVRLCSLWGAVAFVAPLGRPCDPGAGPCSRAVGLPITQHEV